MAVLAPHATARPVADLLEAMSQGVSSFRMEHDLKVRFFLVRFSGLHAIGRKADSVQQIDSFLVMTLSLFSSITSRNHAALQTST